MSDYLGKIIEGKYGKFKVIEDGGWDKMVVLFDNGFITNTSRQMIDKGNIKNPYFPLVAGVGFLGVGIHTPRTNGKTSLEYNTWIGCLHRCYDEKRQIKDVTYKNKWVDAHWHNFQEFARWCQNAVGFGNIGWELDKDIIHRGNLCYGPETCAFVPKDLNIFLKDSSKARGQYPIGVSKVEGESKYRAIVCLNGKPKILGRFETPEEAFTCYKETKEAYIKEKAIKYKDSIDHRVFDSLMLWEVNIDD